MNLSNAQSISSTNFRSEANTNSSNAIIEFINFSPTRPVRVPTILAQLINELSIPTDIKLISADPRLSKSKLI